MPYFTYIIRCRDDTLYTGWTDDVDKRLAAHNSGVGSKYTRAKLPVELVYKEEHPSKSEAMRRERAIKKMSRAVKQCLIATPLLVLEVSYILRFF